MDILEFQVGDKAADAKLARFELMGPLPEGFRTGGPVGCGRILVGAALGKVPFLPLAEGVAQTCPSLFPRYEPVAILIGCLQEAAASGEFVGGEFAVAIAVHRPEEPLDGFRLGWGGGFRGLEGRGEDGNQKDGSRAERGVPVPAGEGQRVHTAMKTRGAGGRFQTK